MTNIPDHFVDLKALSTAQRTWRERDPKVLMPSSLTSVISSTQQNEVNLRGHRHY